MTSDELSAIALRMDADAATSPERAKLRIPAIGAHYLARPRLMESLDASLDTAVTLVIAPAGAGKTTLVSGWAFMSATPAAWLSVDGTDREPTQFWSGVVDALETLH